MKGIAFYGKGGIGKSTILSNVVAALAVNGKKLLQIGCDPKHDSTRLLLGGFTQKTVLEQLNRIGSVSLDSVMLTGYCGIKCIESGGPEPGVGCAGRGIIQMLQLLKEQGLDTGQFDYVFFDVLGDVVCGGFSVPMREGYADEVYIVSSGEIASLYAANNIAKGLKRFSTSHGKLGGVIGNERGTKNEREVITAFARLIGTELVAFVPRSELVVQAELASKPIMQYTPESDIADVFRSIADHVERKHTPVVPKPLSDEELDHFLHEYLYDSKMIKCSASVQKLAGNSSPQSSIFKSEAPKGTASFSDGKIKGNSSARSEKPAHGCSLSGAASVVGQIKDAVAIIHSSQGCSYIQFWSQMTDNSQSSSGERSLPNLLCTNMREKDVIFGGASKLRETILKVYKRFPSSVIFIINSCPAGIIGEDVNSLASELQSEGVSVLSIDSAGVIKGDYGDGVLGAYRAIAENLIDDSVTTLDDSVNVVGEITIARFGEPNFDELRKIFSGLGINVNCRFIRDTSLAEIKHFKRACVNLMFTYGPRLCQTLPELFKTRFNLETLQLPFPAAFNQTAEFTRALALRFGKKSEAEKLICAAHSDYERQLSSLKDFFSGKKALIFSNSHNIDWLLSTLLDLGVEISKVCVSTLSSTDSPVSTKYHGKFEIEQNSPPEDREQVILKTRPDFILAPPLLSGLSYSVPCCAFPIYPNYGFNSGLEYASQLYSKLKVPFNEGWRNDGHLFQGFA